MSQLGKKGNVLEPPEMAPGHAADVNWRTGSRRDVDPTAFSGALEYCVADYLGSHCGSHVGLEGFAAFQAG